MPELVRRPETPGHLRPTAETSGAMVTARATPHGVLLACALATLAALIHVQAAFDHLDQYLPYAVAFIALAIGQAGWAVAAYRSPGHRWLRAGVAAGAAVVLVWLMSRTTGLPIGPEPGVREPIGTLDVVATLDELAAIALAVAALRVRPDHAAPESGSAPGSGRIGRALIAIGLGMTVVSTLVLAGGLHAH